MKKIIVVGFGKIGQAVAANVLLHGHEVVAIDINPVVAQQFESREFRTNEPGLQQILTDSFVAGRLKITDNYAASAGADGLIICIPLIIDEEKKVKQEPFLHCIRSLAPNLRDKRVIVIETSIPVGFSRNEVLRVLEQEGKSHGQDFQLAHSPERIKSGTMLDQLSRIPKIIGGITEEATEDAYRLYLHFFSTQILLKAGSIEAAEMLKLAGMLYRDINIALANQLATFATIKGINFNDLIPLINTDGEANILQPGIGVGGHCTPVYPHFLMENFRSAGLEFTLARESRIINNQMAEFAVSLLPKNLSPKRALILGLSFRPNVKEDSLSTTYLLARALEKAGYDYTVHDTEFSADEIRAKGLTACRDIYQSGASVAFMVTMHAQYRDLDFRQLAASGVTHFIDGRNSVDRKLVEDAGMVYQGIGR